MHEIWSQLSVCCSTLTTCSLWECTQIHGWCCEQTVELPVWDSYKRSFLKVSLVWRDEIFCNGKSEKYRFRRRAVCYVRLHLHICSSALCAKSPKASPYISKWRLFPTSFCRFVVLFFSTGFAALEFSSRILNYKVFYANQNSSHCLPTIQSLCCVCFLKSCLQTVKMSFFILGRRWGHCIEFCTMFIKISE